MFFGSSAPHVEIVILKPTQYLNHLSPAHILKYLVVPPSAVASNLPVVPPKRTRVSTRCLTVTVLSRLVSSPQKR